MVETKPSKPSVTSSIDLAYPGFTPAEIRRFKTRKFGEGLIDPIPYLSRAGVTIQAQHQDEVFSILTQYSSTINFIDTPNGTRIYGLQLKELLQSSVEAMQEISTRFPNTTTEERTERAERDWFGRTHSA